jgi:hypothetical protein
VPDGGEVTGRPQRSAGKVADLPRVRRALDKLDRLAVEHPEAFRLTAQEWRAALAEDKRMTVSKVVAVRLPDSLIARVEAHARRLQELTGLAPSRSEVVKLLVERGLASVEHATAELDKKKKR